MSFLRTERERRKKIIENGYAVRGLLNSLSQNLIEVDEVEEIIQSYISDSCERGYNEGIREAIQTALKGARSV